MPQVAISKTFNLLLGLRFSYRCWLQCQRLSQHGQPDQILPSRELATRTYVPRQFCLRWRHKQWPTNSKQSQPKCKEHAPNPTLISGCLFAFFPWTRLGPPGCRSSPPEISKTSPRGLEAQLLVPQECEVQDWTGTPKRHQSGEASKVRHDVRHGELRVIFASAPTGIATGCKINILYIYMYIYYTLYIYIYIIV